MISATKIKRFDSFFLQWASLTAYKESYFDFNKESKNQKNFIVAQIILFISFKVFKF